MARHLFLILFIAFLSNNIYSQIIFRGLSGYRVQKEDLDYLGQSGLRSRTLLNGDWTVHSENDDPSSAARVNVPSVFEGNKNMIFEKRFRIQPDEISNNILKIGFLGVSYAAEISVNGSLIYRHFGGEMPFSFEVPRDLISTDKSNVLVVKLVPGLDSESTIPIFQRYLFPATFPGIFRDVFLEFLPLENISGFQHNYKISPGRDLLRYRVSVKISNNDFKADSTGDLFDISASLVAMSTGAASDSRPVSFELKKGKEKNIELYIELKSPLLWSPSSPELYQLSLKLIQRGKLIDEIKKPVSFYSLVRDEDSLLLNGQRFRFNGTVYYPGNSGSGTMMNYQKMAEDLEMIKDAGFNSIRFAKTLPNPYLLSLCERIGLLAFIEIPLNSVPVSLVNSNEFINRTKGYISRTLKQYSSYSSVAAFGLGSSYISGQEPVDLFITELVKHSRHLTDKYLYASFTGSNVSIINGLDFYGLENINSVIEKIRNDYFILSEKVGKSKTLFADLGYSHHTGNSNGYVNPYSYEAQAKFYNDFLLYADEAGLNGFFINSMFDYYSASTPINIRPSEDGTVPLGLSGINRGKERLAYKVVSAFLNNDERASIPIGIKENKSPAVFILSGLLTAFLIGVMINSGKKFRDDSVRALLRPYNFYADIRDVRLISGFQTVMLALIVSLLSGNILASLLHYARYSVFFEKTVIAFACKSVTSFVSFLAWSPLQSIIWLTVISLLMIFILSLLVKLGSLFVMNKVSVSNSFFTVVWSFIPFAVLTPVVIVLYRVLEMDYANIYIYGFIAFFYIWSLYRLLKGMYVIYDVSPGKVFFYGIVFIIVVSAAFLMYYQYNYFTLDHIHYAWIQVYGGSN